MVQLQIQMRIFIHENNHINCNGSKNLTKYDEVLQKISDQQESNVAH